MTLVKGRSDSCELDSLGQSIHLLMFHLQRTLWFEWVPSKSNWTGAISRLGHAGPWHQAQGFQVSTSQVPCILWRFPLRLSSQIFSFLV